MRASVRALLSFGVLGAAFGGLAVAESIANDVTPVAAEAAGFGAAVLAGDGEVFVGEAANRFRPGAVYVYRKRGAAWQQASVLAGPDAAVGDQFGRALASDGTRLFVAAGQTALHVFTKRGTEWTRSATLTAAAAGEGARFGAMAADGEWLLVGSPAVGGGRGGRGGPATALPAGSVYAFRRGADGSYAYVQTITAPGTPVAGDNFGSAIALRGTSALVGATGVGQRAGLTHELALGSDGRWSVVRSFGPTLATPGEGFGSALSWLDESTALVGAPSTAQGYGAAYVYRRVTAPGRGAAAGNVLWAPAGRLGSAASVPGEAFGAALAVTGREVWVGAPGAGAAGTVFVYDLSDMTAGPALKTQLRPTGATAAMGHGNALSMRGALAVVGAVAARGGEGAATIYERDAAGAWQASPLLTPPMDELPVLTGNERRCSEQGKVEMFDCSNAELLSFLPPSRLTHDGHYIEMNDSWGWTDPQTGKEWAIIGRRDGTTFVDISNPGRPVPVADLPLTEGARPNSWRDMKVYKDHAYVVADAAGPHGMQVFDLTRLRTLTPQANGLPVKVTEDLVYREIASAHNIVINEESGFAYSVGSSGGGTTCGGGLHMIDVREPKKPTFAGCFADTTTGRASTGYSHDAQCVMYKGPDRRYSGREICIGSNETAISIADVTDKKAPKALSRASYPRVAYTHQGWFTEDQRYFYVNDEIDEIQGVEQTRTLVWDLADLENPKLVKEHMGTAKASDHNLYVKGNLMYQANYRSGLRILDVSDPANPREVGFFKTAPFFDDNPGYNGAWSVYPYFKSGSIVVSSIEQGLFVVKHRPVMF